MVLPPKPLLNQSQATAVPVGRHEDAFLYLLDLIKFTGISMRESPTPRIEREHIEDAEEMMTVHNVP